MNVVREMTSLASEFVRGFEARYGYPPGANTIRLASGEPRTAGLPRQLAELYEVIEEISLPDVGNGYFVDDPERVHAGIAGEQPTRLTVSVEDDVVVFGSDGGGALFALSTTGRGVYRMTNGIFTGSGMPYEDGDITVVAPDIRRFLDFLRDELRAAVAGDR